MFKTTILTLGLLTGFNSFAACLHDTLEIGDIGPGSQLVCDTLASMYPDKRIEITGREIMSHDEVTIRMSIEGQAGSLHYRLVGADWKMSSGDRLAGAKGATCGARTPNRGWTPCVIGSTLPRTSSSRPGCCRRERSTRWCRA